MSSAEVNLAGALSVPLQYRDLIDGLDLDRDIGYRRTRGSLKLREEIASLYTRRKVEPDEILVTTGTAEANFLLLSSLLEPGDEFTLVVPTYLQSVGIARAIGAEVKTVGPHEDEGWKLHLDEIEASISSRAKAILLTNPNNPAGSWFDPWTLEAICSVADRFGAYVIADEALRGLEAEDVMAPSPTELYERGFSTSSLSRIGLSGIRLGWVVGPRAVVEQCWAHKDYTTLAHSGLSETLAELAFKPQNVERFRVRARNFVREYSAILMGWIERHVGVLSCVRPVAGGSAFPAFQLSLDAITFCKRALQQVSVALLPGGYFGAPMHFRIRYGARREVLLDGLSRLDRFRQTSEPTECDILSGGTWRPNKIEGIGDGFIPPILDLEFFDGAVTTTSDEAIAMARRLVREGAILCGIPSGCNVAAALKVARRHPDANRIVTTINDNGLRYPSMELCGETKPLEVPDWEHPASERTAPCWPRANWR